LEWRETQEQGDLVKQLNQDIRELLSLIDGGSDNMDGYWPCLVDRGDGVKGHYCIGRKINPHESFWEFWNSGQWLSAGQVFVGRDVAQSELDRIRSMPFKPDGAAALAEMRGECIKQMMAQCARLATEIQDWPPPTTDISALIDVTIWYINKLKGGINPLAADGAAVKAACISKIKKMGEDGRQSDHGFDKWELRRTLYNEIITALESLSVAPVVEGGETDLAYAQRLAKHLAAEHSPESTDFQVLDTVSGVLSQIDNMIVAWKPGPPGDSIRVAAVEAAEEIVIVTHRRYLDMEQNKAVAYPAVDEIAAIITKSLRQKGVFE
jgi:hypothetical protein